MQVAGSPELADRSHLNYICDRSANPVNLATLGRSQRGCEPKSARERALLASRWRSAYSQLEVGIDLPQPNRPHGEPASPLITIARYCVLRIARYSAIYPARSWDDGARFISRGFLSPRYAASSLCQDRAGYCFVLAPPSSRSSNFLVPLLFNWYLGMQLPPDSFWFFIFYVRNSFWRCVPQVIAAYSATG